MSRTGKPQRQAGVVLAWDWGWSVTANRYTGAFPGDRKVLKLNVQWLQNPVAFIKKSLNYAFKTAELYSM